MHTLGQAGPKGAWPELGSFPHSWGPGPRHCGGWDLRTGIQAHCLPATGAVVLDVACFAEAERLYMLVRDTAVRGRPLTALVLPEVLVSGAKAGLGLRLPLVCLYLGPLEQSPNVCCKASSLLRMGQGLTPAGPAGHTSSACPVCVTVQAALVGSRALAPLALPGRPWTLLAPWASSVRDAPRPPRLSQSPRRAPDPALCSVPWSTSGPQPCWLLGTPPHHQGCLWPLT